MSDSNVFGRASAAPGKAILCMLLGTAFLTSNDAVLKWLTGGYSVGQIMFCRGIFIGIPLFILVWRAGGFASLRPHNPKGHFLRASLVIIGTFLFVTGLRFLPLTEAVAIALDHQANYSVVLIIPYVLSDGAVEFGEAVAQQGEDDMFQGQH